MFAYKNHTQICCWNRPVERNEGKIAQGNSGSLWRCSNSWLTDYKSDAPLSQSAF